MALGGGTFLVQNKVLPGAYINFVSVATATSTLSDRGIATMPLELDWGESGKVFEVTREDFQKNALYIFGYDYTSDKLKGLRDLFKNIKTLYAYRLNGGGEKAANKFATAKYSGIRGNALKIVIKQNVDVSSNFDVQTVLDNEVIETQTVATSKDLIDNKWVAFKTSGTLELTAGVPLTGGTNGSVTGSQHSEYLSKIEKFTFNAMGVSVTDTKTKGLYESFCKRLRDDVGMKFQCVLHNQASDYMGIVNVKNNVTDDGFSEASLVYWVTGIIAGCDANKSNLNKKYDGEFTVNADYTQKELEKAIKNGEFTLHQEGNNVRVLEDINSMVTTTDSLGDVFKDNQTVRVIDQIANDIAVLFKTKYLGVVPNDKGGRNSLWADIVKHHMLLQDIRAIEDFEDKDVTVAQGDTKKAVVVNDAITVINTMAKLYMTVKVS